MIGGCRFKLSVELVWGYWVVVLAVRRASFVLFEPGVKSIALISRATRLREQCTPLALSAACTLGEP